MNVQGHDQDIVQDLDQEIGQEVVLDPVVLEIVPGTDQMIVVVQDRKMILQGVGLDPSH